MCEFKRRMWGVGEGNRRDNRGIFFPLLRVTLERGISDFGDQQSGKLQLIDIELVVRLWENESEIGAISAWLSSCIFLLCGSGSC
jgi:hypothetical protein